MILSKQSWTIIAAFEAGYWVSEHGEVITPKATVLKGSVNPSGYQVVCVFTDYDPRPKGRTVPTHRMAAYQEFGLTALLQGSEVRHRNRVRLDNRPLNMRVGKRADTIMAMTKVERTARLKGSVSPKRVLTEQDADAIREVYKRGLMWGECKDLAEHYGVSPTTISDIGRKKFYVNKRQD